MVPADLRRLRRADHARGRRALLRAAPARGRLRRSRLRVPAAAGAAAGRGGRSFSASSPRATASGTSRAAGGLRPLVSNAWMASVPGHPFWEHVARELVRCHLAPGPLDATGPFLLTRACLCWPLRDEITLVPPSLLSPIAGDEPWEEFDPEVREAIARRAFVAHHWMGSWWRKADPAGDDRVGLTMLERGPSVCAGTTSAAWLEAEASRLRPDPPLVSCLMVTKDRPGLARRAVRCFQAQRWPARELVIVDDGRDGSARGVGRHPRGRGDPPPAASPVGSDARRAAQRRRSPRRAAPTSRSGTTTTSPTRGASRSRWRRSSHAGPPRACWSGSSSGGRTRGGWRSPAAGSGRGRSSRKSPPSSRTSRCRRGEDTPVIERLVAGEPRGAARCAAALRLRVPRQQHVRGGALGGALAHGD